MFECGAWLGGEWLRTSGKDICIRGSQLRRGLYFYEVPTLNQGHLLVKLWSHDSDRQNDIQYSTTNNHAEYYIALCLCLTKIV